MREENDHSNFELKDMLQVSQKMPNTETISLKDPIKKRVHPPINYGFECIGRFKILTFICWARTCKS